VEVFLGGRSNGTPVILNACHGGGSEQWQRTATGYRNPQSNRCLTVGSGRLTITDCTGGGSQQLTLT
jgi:hypothetical protein